MSRALLGLLLRDAALLGVVLAAWRYTLAGPDAGALHVVLAIGTALLTTLLGYLLHEWGHLLGAIVARGAYALPETPFESPFLFRFDVVRNGRREFCSMSLGGFIASIITVIVLVLVLPRGELATTLTLAFTALGVLATFVLEVPVFVSVWRGGPLPTGAAFVSDTKG